MANSECKNHSARRSTPLLTKKTHRVVNVSLTAVESDMIFCPRFMYEILPIEKAMSCSYGGTDDWYGLASDVVGLFGPRTVILISQTILTGWSHGGFRTSIQGGRNCFREGTRGDQMYTTRTYVTRLCNHTSLMFVEFRNSKEKHYYLLSNERNMKAAEVTRLIKRVASLFPTIGLLCSTNCTRPRKCMQRTRRGKCL